MSRWLWRFSAYRRFWYWFVFKYLCPKPERTRAEDW